MIEQAQDDHCASFILFFSVCVCVSARVYMYTNIYCLIAEPRLVQNLLCRTRKYDHPILSSQMLGLKGCTPPTLISSGVHFTSQTLPFDDEEGHQAHKNEPLMQKGVLKPGLVPESWIGHRWKENKRLQQKLGGNVQTKERKRVSVYHQPMINI